MEKKIITLLAAIAASTTTLSTYAFDHVTAYNQPISTIKNFNIVEHTGRRLLAGANHKQGNQLVAVSTTIMNGERYTRYQQNYNGIPVVGKQVVVKQPQTMMGFSSLDTATKIDVAQNLTVDVQPTFSKEAAIVFAKQQFSQKNAGKIVNGSEAANKQIRIIKNKPGLYYDVSFHVEMPQGAPKHMHYIITANGSAKMQSVLHWDNIQNYDDIGPGGNVKTEKFGDGKELWYGKDGLSALDVSKSGDQCTMDNGRVSLINLKTNPFGFSPYSYVCGTDKGDPVNGAFSPSDDAYYFGDVIINMYKEWYQTDALQQFGKPMKLVMRVHYGTDYDNAFWNGSSMTFGDGSRFYPLVSLDVAGHEVSHGFTEQHSGLEYHDQPGSLNEAFSDMAGQATRAYLLSKDPALYGKLYYGDTAVTWGLGETISKGAKEKSLRYMNDPSKDGRSADCYDKALATASGAQCKITYADVVKNAGGRQGVIVHTGSGVFNKAFALLSDKIGIKEAFRTFKDANAKYWTPNSDFEDAACGVLHAAKDDGIRSETVVTVFNQVGVNTKQCQFSA
jgi:vibriolysin